MSISDSNTKKFKEILLKRLKESCYRSRVAKDSSREHVVLLGNQRIELNNKSIWSSEKCAQRAIEKYIKAGKSWNLSIESMWKCVVNGDWNTKAPAQIGMMAVSIREEWADKNLRIIPLRDYMVLEYNRNKDKQ